MKKSPAEMEKEAFTTYGKPFTDEVHEDLMKDLRASIVTSIFDGYSDGVLHTPRDLYEFFLGAGTPFRYARLTEAIGQLKGAGVLGQNVHTGHLEIISQMKARVYVMGGSL